MKTLEKFNDTVNYLASKKVPFMVKTDYTDNTVSIIGVKITKQGKFFRANGKVIAGNMLSQISLFI